VTDEKHLPYDRPVLSKNLSKGEKPEDIALRSAEHFAEHDIEVHCGASVANLDASSRTLRLTSGEELNFDSVLVASGAKPRVLPIPGFNLPKVISLRTPEDAQRISAACQRGKRVVVIGSSFNGMELAASLTRAGCQVTVVGMEAIPFERVLGASVGSAIKAFFESKGVKVLGSTAVANISEDPKGAMTAVLQSGEKLDCDAVVVGAGVTPQASFVEGVDKATDGSLLTDECMQTSAENVFAAGDVATFLSPLSKEQFRIEHWQVAMSQGRIAAKNMLGQKVVFDVQPFFWTVLFGKNLRYVGHCTDFDELHVEGDLDKLNFVAYYCKNGAVKAVATMARDPVAAAAGELLRLGHMPSLADLKKGTKTSADIIQEMNRLNR